MKWLRCSHAKNVEDLERDLGEVKAKLERLETLAKDLDPERITRHAVERINRARSEEMKREAIRRREEAEEREQPLLPAF